VLARSVRGGWIVVLCLAVLALSSPAAPIATPDRSPAIGKSSTDLVAITRMAGLYDLSRAPKTIHEWKSDRQKHRPLRYSDGAALASTGLRIESQQAGPESREHPVAAAFRPFRAFDAQAPPSDC
jgi:hypothetical protein